MDDDDKDLRQVLADTPWSAIVAPLIIALLVVVAIMFITLSSE